MTTPPSRVIALRDAHGWTDAQIAEHLGLTEPRVWQIRTGYDRRPEVLERRKLYQRARRARVTQESPA